MPSMATKRERFLDWIRNGDPDKAPVLVNDVAASYLGRDIGDVTWDEAVSVAEETGTHALYFAHSPYPGAALPFLEDIRISEDFETLTDGTRRITRLMETPEGTLRSIEEHPVSTGPYHREFYVKDENDLPAFTSFIRKTSEEVVRNPAVRRAVDEQFKAAMAPVKGAFPAWVHFFCPAVHLMSAIYMDQETAVMMVYDHQDLMEEMMDCYGRMNQVWLEVAVANGIDVYNYAINGYEWLSPDLYERYMIPQARVINEFAEAEGKLSWIHTCGKIKRIAQAGTYQRMKVHVVESLSSLPTGDIDDLAQTRRDIGGDIVTRGGINVEYFYSDDIEAIKKQAEHVLDSTAGYKHILSDTNGSYPAYPWINVQAVIDVVRARGQLLE